jgi:quercetin dioxygenase-like cupin family protein
MTSELESAAGRRGFLAMLLTGLVPAAGAPPASRVVFDHDAPNADLTGWKFVAVELTFPPGSPSARHLHPGFVLGYVLEGDFRFQLEGQPEAVYHTGEMFYEPLASHHIVGESATPAKSARVLAIVFGDKGKPLTVPL